MSVQEHKKQHIKAKCAVLTISDTRNVSNDKSGQVIHELLEENAHELISYAIVKDEAETIVHAVQQVIKQRVDVLIVNGGTGLAKRDVTIEAVEPLFDKQIVGFGELFRMISYQEDIGSAALLSRAAAGIYEDSVIFLLPGSSNAIRLAMNKLILPEISHLVSEVKKDL